MGGAKRQRSSTSAFRDDRDALRARNAGLEEELGRAKDELAALRRGATAEATAAREAATFVAPGARRAIARNPRRAWPLVVVLGVPTALLVGVLRLVASAPPGALGPSWVAVVVALAAFGASGALLVGLFQLALPAQRRPTTGRTLAAGAIVHAGLVASVALASRGFVPEPRGWPAGLPRYPGACLRAEPSDARSGGGTFVRAKHGYEQALRAAGRPANAVVADCPSFGRACSGYAVGEWAVVECAGAESFVRVRYGAPPCAASP